MRLLSPKQTTEDIKSKDYQYYKKYKKLDDIVRKKELEVNIVIKKLEKDKLIAEDELQKSIEEKNANINELNNKISSLEVRRKKLLEPITEIRKDAQNELLKAEKIKDDADIVFEENKAKQGEIDAKMPLLKEREDNITDKEEQIVITEKKVKEVKEITIACQELIEKEKKEHEEIIKKEIKSINNIKKLTIEYENGVKLKEELVNKKEQELKKERKHIESQQQSLKQAFAEAKAKNIKL